jgi:hypothetical protein
VRKTLPTWAFGVLAVMGVVLVGSMLLNWVDIDGQFQISGLTLAWDANHWLFLVPVAGGALVATAASRSEHTRLAAIFAGIAITGYVLFDVARSMIHSGLDTWLILGGAGAMLAGVSKERSMWRAVGGIAVLAGFFAPWAPVSMWNLLTTDFLGADFTVRILWLIPLAGIAAILSAASAVKGAKVAAIAGIAIYGSLLWVIGAVAWAVFGIGAWAALGASTLALVLGVLARGPAENPAAAAKLSASL